MPQDTSEQFQSATAAYREGRLEDAQSIVRQVLDQSPDDQDAILLTGMIAVKQDRLDEAVRQLSRTAELNPTSYLAHFWLATAQRKSGDLSSAVANAESAVSLNADEPQAILLLGLCYMDIEDWSAAEVQLERARTIAPNAAAVYFNLGRVFEAQKRPKDSISAYQIARTLNPTHIETLQRLGQALALQVDFEGTADCANQVLQIDPNSAFGYSLLAISQVGKNRPEEAVRNAARALELEPDRPEALTLYGTILQATGRMEESEPILKRSIELDALQGYAYYALCRTHRIAEPDLGLVQQMERALVDRRLSQKSAGELEYALGKAYADLGSYKLAMAHYDSANRFTREVRFGMEAFNRESFAAETERHIERQDRRFIERHHGFGLSDDVPIFVVGMMRSGTTLVEQILSNHEQVGAAGEQRFWNDNRNMAFLPSSGSTNQEHLDQNKLTSLASTYLELLDRFAPGMGRVVDKMPGNYANLGLIHVAFPNARVIHIRRNPIDTCLSIWMTPNSTPLSWANAKSDVVFVYKQYEQIMRHWREVLPKDRLLEIDYETLATDPAPIVREMLEFCGLSWDERCLRPEENERSVATPSGWQVRQPIYTTAVDRWRKYEPWLGEFRSLSGL